MLSVILNSPSNVHDSQLTRRCRLENDSDEGEGRNHEKTRFSSPTVGNGFCDKGSGKCSSLHNGHYIGREIGACEIIVGGAKPSSKDQLYLGCVDIALTL